jgi:hypothetical protein
VDLLWLRYASCWALPTGVYLEFLSASDNPGSGLGKLNQVTRSVQQETRSYRGFNFFDPENEKLFLALTRGEFPISGLQHKTLRRWLPPHNSEQLSRILRRLRYGAGSRMTNSNLGLGKSSGT